MDPNDDLMKGMEEITKSPEFTKFQGDSDKLYAILGEAIPSETPVSVVLSAITRLHLDCHASQLLRGTPLKDCLLVLDDGYNLMKKILIQGALDRQVMKESNIEVKA